MAIKRKQTISRSDYENYCHVFRHYLSRHDLYAKMDRAGNPEAHRLVLNYYYLLEGMLQAARALGALDENDYERFEEKLYKQYE